MLPTDGKAERMENVKLPDISGSRSIEQPSKDEVDGPTDREERAKTLNTERGDAAVPEVEEDRDVPIS